MGETFESDISVRRVLVSLSDKSGLADFVEGLKPFVDEFVATGTTAQALRGWGIPCRAVEELTSFPEILGGRVKTLHPAIFGGILARRSLVSDQSDLERLGIGGFDLVVCNLYPFQERLVTGASASELIEAIDIGGVSLLRAAAKNHAHVGVVCDVADYGWLVEELRASHGKLSLETRARLAVKALGETAAYDSVIASTLAAGHEPLAAGPQRRLASAAPALPQALSIGFRKVRDLRYGENPHQKAALYEEAAARHAACNVAALACEHGKEPSFNNMLDIEHAVRLAHEFSHPAVVIVKHNTPCCVAEGESSSLRDLYARAFECDPVSPFGGIVVANREVDESLALLMNETFLEVVVAPAFEPAARALLERKRNLRIVTLDPALPLPNSFTIAHVQGGILVQSVDAEPIHPGRYEVVTRRSPTASQTADLVFAEKVVKHTRSNAIVLAKEGRAIAVAGGFTNRVDAVEQCLRKARVSLEGAVLASDAFFPFADSIELLRGKGIAAIVQPGGSVRDAEVVSACNDLGIAMVFSGLRHFKH